MTTAEAQLSEQLPKFEQENNFIDIDKLLDESAMKRARVRALPKCRFGYWS